MLVKQQVKHFDRLAAVKVLASQNIFPVQMSRWGIRIFTIFTTPQNDKICVAGFVFLSTLLLALTLGERGERFVFSIMQK